MGEIIVNIKEADRNGHYKDVELNIVDEQRLLELVIEFLRNR